MNIALLHYSCPLVVGGVEEIVRQQASLFLRYGNRVKVLAGAGDPSMFDCPVEIEPLLGSRDPRVLEAQEGSSDTFESEQPLVSEILAILARSLDQFDVLIAHNVLTMQYNLALAHALHQIADEGRIRLISWNHDSPFFYRDFRERFASDTWQILRRYNKRIRYVAISESRKKQFERLYGGNARLDVIPNGIDPIQFFGLNPATVRLIQEERLFETDFLLVQPSRLHPRKNIELSIRVTRALRDRGLCARLLLTGAYDPHEKATLDYYRTLKRLAAELDVEADVLIMEEYFYRTREKHAADRITMRDLYLIADILFLPSWQEGFGVPLLEAGMIKLPIFCSDIAPFREIGADNVHFFSLSDSPGDIAGVVIEHTESLPCHRMFRKVIHDHVWDNIYLKKLLPLLQDVICADDR